MSTTSPKTKEKVSRFISENLKESEKTEKDIFADELKTFQVDAQVEVKMQIGIREGELTKKQTRIEAAENSVKRSDEALEKAKFYMPTSGRFSDYLSNWNEMRNNQSRAKANLDCINQDCEQIKSEIEEFKSILKNFS